MFPEQSAAGWLAAWGLSDALSLAKLTARFPKKEREAGRILLYLGPMGRCGVDVALVVPLARFSPEHKSRSMQPLRNSCRPASHQRTKPTLRRGFSWM
jgi:hypothetical protein